MIKKITILECSAGKFLFREKDDDKSEKYDSYENALRKAMAAHCQRSDELPPDVQFDYQGKELSHVKFIILKHPNNRLTLKKINNGCPVEYNCYFNSYEDAAKGAIEICHQEKISLPMAITFHFEKDDTWIQHGNNN